MAKAKYTGICECCGIEFFAKTRLKRFCSISCKSKQPYLVPSIDATCKHCGKHFKAKRKCRSTFCSRSCQATYVAIVKREIAAIHRLKPKYLYSMALLIEIAALHRIKKLNKKLYEAKSGTKKHKLCKKCNNKFVYVVVNGCPPKYCQHCKEQVYADHKRKSSRISKAKRRAIYKRAEAESIDPFDIFERDGWRCHICGCKTPKSKRGTYSNNAPEIDHIVTLADGGSHILSNVACACRKCNQKKSSVSFGQLKMSL
jgi:hypothetical protein